MHPAVSRRAVQASHTDVDSEHQPLLPGVHIGNGDYSGLHIGRSSDRGNDIANVGVLREHYGVKW